MNAEETVLVVIPNYNGAALIEACLESVQNQTHSDIETVVVDNASSDDSVSKIRKRFPKVKILIQGRNTGWGQACNAGIEASSAPYVLVLNNDATLEPGCVSEMLRALRSKPEYGSAACRILLSEHRDTAEVCGLAIYRDGSSCARGRLAPAEQYMQTEEVFGASGCCALYRRSLFERVGLFDPEFFMYCDDTDMAWRAQWAGLPCIYTPKAVAYHSHSSSAGSYSPMKAFYVERNRIFVCLKHFPAPALVMSGFYAVSRHLTQVLLARTEKKGALSRFLKNHSLLGGFGILLRAHAEAFLKAPGMLVQKSRASRYRKQPLSYFRILFQKFGVSTRQMAGYE